MDFERLSRTADLSVLHGLAGDSRDVGPCEFLAEMLPFLAILVTAGLAVEEESGLGTGLLANAAATAERLTDFCPP